MFLISGKDDGFLPASVVVIDKMTSSSRKAKGVNQVFLFLDQIKREKGVW
jgi:hypothetical protein